MSEELNVQLLRDTFNRVLTENGGATGFGLRFYQRMFANHPEVRPLFVTPPEDQHKKLVASLGVIVSSVTLQDRLVPYLHAMGVRHLKYKTEPEHYAVVGENLLAVLKEHLSVEGEWTDEMQRNWEAAVNLVATVMIDAANHPDKYKDEMAQAGYLPDGFKAKDPQPWLMPASA